jgi:AbrB family looped-hinge helix DNA binding protein
MKSRMGERGQIVIPKPYRDRLGLRGGQVMEIREERGRLIVTKGTPDDDPIDAVYGILRRNGTDPGFARTDDFIRELRGGDPDAVDPEPAGT